MLVLRLISLLLGVLGTILVFIGSPVNTGETYLYNASEINAIKNKNRRKNNLSKIGMILLLICFVIELTDIINANSK